MLRLVSKGAPHALQHLGYPGPVSPGHASSFLLIGWTCGLRHSALHAVRESRLAISAVILNNAPRTPNRVGWKSRWVPVRTLRSGREVDPLSPTPIRWNLACALIAVDTEGGGANVKFLCAPACIRSWWRSHLCVISDLKRTSVYGFASSEFCVPDNLGFYM